MPSEQSMVEDLERVLDNVRAYTDVALAAVKLLSKSDEYVRATLNACRDARSSIESAEFKAAKLWDFVLRKEYD